MNTFARLRGTIQSCNTNVDSLSSVLKVLQNGQTDTEFFRDGANAQEALQAAQNSKLVQQFADVQKNVTTTCKSMSEYHSKLFSDI